jgi:phosphoethanolamine N-methyltransferase
VEGKRLLELGAGIGRFTGDLARTAKAVHAVDFMQSFTDANKEANSKHKNVTVEVPPPFEHIYCYLWLDKD